MKKKRATDAEVYSAYLGAYAANRSRLGVIEDCEPAGGERVMAARALGASDGLDSDFLPAPKWAVLEQVNDLLFSKKRERPCNVVPLNDKTGETH